MNPFSKQAAAPYFAGISPEAAEVNNEAKAEAVRRALKTGLMGLGVGGLFTLLSGIKSLTNPSAIPSYKVDEDITLPYPQLATKASANLSIHNPFIHNTLGGSALGAAYGAYADPEDRVRGALDYGLFGGLLSLGITPASIVGKKATEAAIKSVAKGTPWSHPEPLNHFSNAGGALAAIGAIKPAIPLAKEVQEKLLDKKADLANTFVNNVIPTVPGQKNPMIGSPSWVSGTGFKNVESVPWALPAASMAFLGGTYGGHKLVKSLLKSRRKKEIQKRLQEAQKEYEEAMLSQYDPAKLRKITGFKTASASTPLDACFDLLFTGTKPVQEKLAAVKKAVNLNELLGQGAGLYLTGAGLLGLGSGVGMYKYLESRSKAKLLRDALKQRALLKSLSNPAEIYVSPQPVEFVEEKEKPSPHD